MKSERVDMHSVAQPIISVLHDKKSGYLVLIPHNKNCHELLGYQRNVERAEVTLSRTCTVIVGRAAQHHRKYESTTYRGEKGGIIVFHNRQVRNWFIS